jgi:hypothetical protein
MTFQFLCPQGHLLQGEEQHMGMQCQCPQCGVAFIIPTIERPQQPATAAVQSPGSFDPLVEDDPLSQGGPFSPSDPYGGTGGALEGVGNLSETFQPGDLSDAAVEESLLHIPCPNGHELDVPLDMLGGWAMCPHCRAEFRLSRKKSLEYLREQELIDRQRAEFWFRLAIIVGVVVGLMVLVMIIATVAF